MSALRAVAFQGRSCSMEVTYRLAFLRGSGPDTSAHGMALTP